MSQPELKNNVDNPNDSQDTENGNTQAIQLADLKKLQKQIILQEMRQMLEVDKQDELSDNLREQISASKKKSASKANLFDALAEEPSSREYGRLESQTEHLLNKRLDKLERSVESLVHKSMNSESNMQDIYS